MPEDLGPCPSSDRLEGAAAGQYIAPADREHVVACPICRETLQRIRDDNEFLADFRVKGALPRIAPDQSASQVDIPGYDVICELHRGGQGVVYQAVQRSTKREVAIKVIRQGLFATTADRTRFSREIETLGRLDHPNIVAVHDAGVVGGLHYFVMDYVDGLPLDEAVLLGAEPQPVASESASATGAVAAPAEKRLDGRRAVAPDRLVATLQIFVKICDAVHAAHLRGVMHRDLKPSNIRVDRSGEPHVLDFGLAKSIDETDPAMTMTGQFVGSLPWASPEQIEGASNRIDLRTDVYSLGAILFQLLTGRVPFEMESSLRATVDNILQRDPPRPSEFCTVLDTRIDDDLETIVLKCLSKERERRYQSAGELARDLRHYLADEAIDAKRDSAWYVLRKTAWRKRRVFAAVAVPMVLFPFALYGFYRSTIATRQAELERELRQISAVRNAAMLEITRRLQARPGSATDSPGGRLSRINADAIRNDLDTGSLSVSDHSVALLLAETLRDRGMIVEAEGLLRRALYMLQTEHGPRHPEIGRMRAILADVLLRRGTRMAEAEQMAELAVRELTSAFGQSSPETTRGWIVLARVRLARGDSSGALEAARQALNTNEPTGSIRHVEAQAMIARVRAERGEREEARAAYLEAVRNMLLLTHDTDSRLLDVIDLGAAMIELGVLPAEELFDPSVLRGALAGMSPDAALHEVTVVLRGGADGTARDDSIVPARLVMADLRAHLLGSEHPSLGASLASIAASLLEAALQRETTDLAGVEEAAAFFRRAIPLQIAAHGSDSPLVGKSYENLATCMVESCRLHEATRWFALDCELWMRQTPELRDDYQIMLRARWTGWHATRAGDYELALRWLDLALELVAQSLGPEDGGAALIHACRALCLASLDRGEEALASAEITVRILNTQTVPQDQQFDCKRFLGLAHLRLGRLDDARGMIEPTWRAVQPSYELARTGFRLEWARTMLEYCRGIGDVERAAQFEQCIRENGTGDFRLDDASPASSAADEYE